MWLSFRGLERRTRELCACRRIPKPWLRRVPWGFVSGTDRLKKKRAGSLPPSRNQPFHGALATAPPSDQSLTMATKPVTMAARLAVPIIRVSVIMCSPPLVGLFRGERKNVADGVIGTDFPRRVRASGEFLRAIFPRSSVRGGEGRRHRGCVHRPDC